MENKVLGQSSPTYTMYCVPIGSDRGHANPFARRVKQMASHALNSMLVSRGVISRLVRHLVRQVWRGQQSVYLGNNRVLTRNILGQKMYLPADDVSLTPHLILDGYWELGVTNFFLRIVREGDTVVDVGANVGYYTLLAASRVGQQGRVYTFEPMPDLFDLLYRNTEINGFLGHCRLLSAAVSDEEGEITLQKVWPHYGAGGRYVNKETLEMYRAKAEVIQVKAVTLDLLFKREGGRVDIVKIDAEGAEPQVIIGMKQVLESNESIKLIMEWSQVNLAAVEALLSMGFSIRLIQGNGGLMPVTIEGLKLLHHAMIFAARSGS